ncbi:MAG: lipoyl(octanoyl) transferase LipB [Akkermansiaceae bacterium]
MNLTTEWLGDHISYQDALAIQEAKLLEVLNNESPDTFFTLEHAPIYTIGRTKDKSSLLDPTQLPHPQLEINRGGQATYHGPGQLVGYTIIDLKNLGKDLHTFIHSIERALVLTCQDYGVNATTKENLTGVWVGEKKLASIGVGVRKWISMHGFAINITRESLTGFNHITPCGIQGVSMTTVCDEIDKNVTTREFAESVTPHLESELKKLTHP